MYYFSEQNIRGNHAGTKARNDVEKILRDYGCKPVNPNPYVLRSGPDESQIYSNVTHRYQLWRLFHEVKRLSNEIVIVQYPMLAFDNTEEYFTEISRNNKLVLIIHDIHSLKRQDLPSLQKEISLLNRADAVIVHNNAMKQVLMQYGFNVKNIFILGLFDYLYDSEKFIDHSSDAGIVFAGNLDKSVFIQSMIQTNKEVLFQLYGQQSEDWTRFGNVEYHGSFPPDELPGSLSGKYGLVWDGVRIDQCSGIFGQYLRYNNPHKTSLYIAADLPVIIWEQAAIADLVERYHIGILVSDLHDLNTVMQRVTDDEYRIMQSNIHQMKEKVITGSYLKKQLYNIESRI